jgi:hypothetical protein
MQSALRIARLTDTPQKAKEESKEIIAMITGFDWQSLKVKFLNFIASLCFVFNVDWDKDFPDDEYCAERKNK